MTTRRILTAPNRFAAGAGRQQGTALFVALISLVIMTLGAFALVRAIDTSTIIAGNVGFKQAALISTDAGIETAITWVQGNAAALTADVAAQGYYATEQAGLDIKGRKTPTDPADDVDWDGSNSNTTTKARILPEDPTTGNRVALVINRLCLNPGDINATDQSCVRTVSAGNSTTSSHSGPSYGQGAIGDNSVDQVYYRVTARVVRPRNTVTYVQAVILI